MDPVNSVGNFNLNIREILCAINVIKTLDFGREYAICEWFSAFERRTTKTGSSSTRRILTNGDDPCE